MFKKRFYYLFKIQYLGFRYHGWQKQPGLLTVERMMERTLAYVLDRKNFKFIAAGRTDAKVSANVAFVELILDDLPLELDQFLKDFNTNLPQDVRLLEINEVDKKFNIIQHPKIKEYIYLFSFGKKNHPFCAPFMVHFMHDLDIKTMQEGALKFQGTHDFKNYAYKATAETKTMLTVDTCIIEKNTLYTASFFPEVSYLLRVRGEGFKRHQVRLMMGALVDLGAGSMSMIDFEKTLQPDEVIKLTHIAQASGLMLHDVQFVW